MKKTGLVVSILCAVILALVACRKDPLMAEGSGGGSGSTVVFDLDAVP